MTEMRIGIAGSGFIAENLAAAMPCFPDMRLESVLTRRRPEALADTALGRAAAYLNAGF